MSVSEKIHNYILEKREEILKEYFDVLRIPSISGTPEAYEALKHVKSVYEKNGFSAELYEDYLLAYHNESASHKIGLFAHADVVPVNDDWLKTTPFAPVEEDGILYGRGICKSAEILDIALKFGFIEKSGSWFSYDGQRIGQGKDKARAYLESEDALMKELEEKIKEKYRSMDPEEGIPEDGEDEDDFDLREFDGDEE